MVAIPAEQPAFSGTPRLPADQYIQEVIDGESAGTTYNLEAGIHRGQNIVLKAGDTLIIEEGAVVNGAEDIDGDSGWTPDSSEWKKTIQAGDVLSDSDTDVRAGYDATKAEWIIIDGIPRTWVTTQGAVDEFSAFYSGTEVFIGVDPSGKDVEIARANRIHGAGANCTIRGESSAERGVIRGYACGDNTSGANGDSGVWLQGINSLYRDLEIFAMAGDGLALWAESETYNVTVHHCGHLAIVADANPDEEYPTDIILGEGCWIYNGGIAGYESGDEGGNTKFFGTIDLTVKGTLWDYGDHPHKHGQGPFWLDINDDGYEIFANVIRDFDHGGKRGLFVETCYSGNVHNNICIELGWAGENSFWGNGIIISSAGPDEFGNSRLPKLSVYNNLLYHCAGGVRCLGNRDTGPEGWHRWDNPYIHDIDVWGNTTVFDGSAFGGWDEPVGVTIDEQYLPPDNIDYFDNIYFVAAGANRWNDDAVGGIGSDESWANWQGSGHTYDDAAPAERIVDGGYDPYPFNGGAM
jgi:hypothetical protein